MSERKVTVVCDTTACLPREIIDQHGIKEVSLYVILGDDSTRESEISDYDGFFAELRDTEKEFKTSQPSVGDFRAAYEPILAEGQSIVSIHLSGGISGTCDSARQARQALINDGLGGERIEVVDSRSAAGGTGIVVLAAAVAAGRGKDLASCVATADAARESLKIWFAVDTLEYLRRSGRVGAAQAWLGSALQIKPILTLGEEIEPVDKVRTSKRAFARMTEYGREMLADGRTAWVVQHIRNLEMADRLVEEGREIFGSEPLFVGEVGPVLGAHTGPGMLGIGGTAPKVFEP